MATGNPQKMALISSTKEWPQIDENNFIMEKPTQDHHHHQQQQQILKCPRCDSSNTKFCYYNNYSLSQPRHFCKACKRYWTRGGTLRNVPVGGGCRKNKKVKRPPSISAVDSSSPSSSVLIPTTATSAPNPNSVVHMLSSTSNHMNPPLFYGLPTYPTMINSRVSNVDTGYDLQPQMNALGLGFSSGFNTTNSNSLLSSYPIFGSSSLQQQKYISANSFLGLGPNYEEEMQMQGMKEVKMEETQKRLDLINVPNNFQNQIEQMGSSSDPSLLWMLDPANIGSSVPSLI